MSANPENLFGSAANDADAQETREWMDALSSVIQSEGPERAHFLLEQLLEHARQHSIDKPFSANTAYVNTIEPDQEERCPGNLEIEERLRAYMRWNAMAMVVKANRHHPAEGGDLGGHIGSFASLANMFGAGFNHFWHAESENHGGDCLYIQGHVSPGIYARAYLEGRLSEEQLLNFRQEVDGKGLDRIHRELLELGASRPRTRVIQTVLFHPGFPVDVRHNAKISREKLADWAARHLGGPTS